MLHSEIAVVGQIAVSREGSLRVAYRRRVLTALIARQTANSQPFMPSGASYELLEMSASRDILLRPQKRSVVAGATRSRDPIASGAAVELRLSNGRLTRHLARVSASLRTDPQWPSHACGGEVTMGIRAHRPQSEQNDQ